jgi:hypothetical protein
LIESGSVVVDETATEPNGDTGSRGRMTLTREGIDPAILEAARVAGVPDWRPLVEGRCLELLRAFPTTLKEDRAAFSTSGASDRRRSSRRRCGTSMSKKEVLLGPLAAAAARQREAARETMHAAFAACRCFVAP